MSQARDLLALANSFISEQSEKQESKKGALSHRSYEMNTKVQEDKITEGIKDKKFKKDKKSQKDKKDTKSRRKSKSRSKSKDKEINKEIDE